LKGSYSTTGGESDRLNNVETVFPSVYRRNDDRGRPAQVLHQRDDPIRDR
jgi:hypothetical protein